MGLAAVAVAFASAFGWVFLTGDSRSPQPTIRLTLNLPEGDQLSMGGISAGFAVSPDGRDLVYVAIRDGVRQLYHRPFDSDEARPLAGTEGARGPFFSPNGQWVGFFSGTALRRVNLTGSLPVLVCELRNEQHGAAWGQNDTIYFGLHNSSIWQVAAGASGRRFPRRRSSGHRLRLPACRRAF